MGARRCTAAGADAAGGQGSRIATGAVSDRQADAYFVANRDAGCTAAGRNHAGQRVSEGERGLLLPGDRRKHGTFASAKLSLRDLAARTDHTAQSGRAVRIGLHSLRARKGKLPITTNP